MYILILIYIITKTSICMYIMILYMYVLCILMLYIYISYHEKAFRSDLSIQIKKPFPSANYLLRITFSCYSFVVGNFVRFFLTFSFFLGVDVI